MDKSLKERVQALEKQNTLLVDYLADTIWVLNSTTLKYEYITPSEYKISGYRPEELIDISVEGRFTAESSLKAAAMLEKEIEAYKQGKHVSQSFELELKHKNGSTYWVESRAKLIEDSDGSLKIVGLSREITARKKAEKQLADKNLQLSSMLAEKEKLLKEIKMLQELLPICSACKRIRDEKGNWWPLEIYVSKHTNSNFTHTICQDCKKVIYAEPDK